MVESLINRYELTKTPEFVAAMIHQIRVQHATMIRIHSDGDFYDAPYIRKWIKIAKRCSSTVFFTYTRTWRCAAKLPALRELAMLKNVRCWWSTDVDTHRIDGRPPSIPGVRVAHLRAKLGEWIPGYVDLIFRPPPRNTIEKFDNGRLICPAENGYDYVYKMTCSQCRICYRRRPVVKKPRQSSRKIVVQV
jgi:hypothetical protein